MERLTIPDVRVDEHTTRRTMIDVDAVREHAMDFYWRLKAYEDTERTPEEVTALGKLFDYALEESKTLTEQLALLNRIRDLAEADRAGRLVVLPCKVGDMVYVINRHLGQIFASTVISINVGNSTDLKNYIRTKWVGEKGNESIRTWALRQVGRYVFLTREAAEAALEATKNE